METITLLDHTFLLDRRTAQYQIIKRLSVTGDPKKMLEEMVTGIFYDGATKYHISGNMLKEAKYVLNIIQSS